MSDLYERLGTPSPNRPDASRREVARQNRLVSRETLTATVETTDDDRTVGWGIEVPLH